MEHKESFILTTDKISADMMKKAGFQLITSQNGNFIFMNNQNIYFNFSNVNVCFTNILTF
ncbi:unknown [Firmicutes bacterium CAG:466]|jgi:hypothetical protein|nr:unknown [Firmicutes bacterium CAG:466]